MANEMDYVELGLLCATTCRVLEQVTNGMELSELTRYAMGQLEL